MEKIGVFLAEGFEENEALLPALWNSSTWAISPSWASRFLVPGIPPGSTSIAYPGTSA